MKKGPKGKRPGPPVNDDLRRRNVTAAGPNRKWITDLTEYPTGERKAYCCTIKDLFYDRMTADLALNVLRTSLARRESDSIVIVHADRGSQRRARSF